MWRRLLIVTGLAALAAYFLRRRPAAAPVVEVDPAEELRRKLDEVKASEGAEDGAEADDTPVADLDARRRDVHERARAAVDEMQGSSSD